MRIGAALVLIAIGAILRFALTTVVTHGVDLRTVGDILMVVGVLGLILWLFIWAPWARNRNASVRQTSVRQTSDGDYAGAYPPGERRYEERRYEDQYPG
ncbi:MAG TPA: hypothetical protein VFQ44_18630 [Streptosporangiaceae bacterium]|nr:hypothetical protein [Streptosporangiaceae bacterium]